MISCILSTARHNFPIIGLPSIHIFEPTLRSLEKQTFKDFELIICDALYPQRKEWIERTKWSFPIKYVPAHANHRFWLDHKRWNVCFSSGTPILTIDGVKSIEDIKEGDTVLGNNSFTNVVKVFSRIYDGQLIKIKARGYPELLVTPEHPLYISRCQRHEVWNKESYGRYIIDKEKPNWVQAQDIRTPQWGSRKSVFDCVLVPRVIDENDFSFKFTIMENQSKVRKDKDIHLNREIARLFGWYLAEGFVYKTKDNHYRITFTLGDKEVEYAKEIEKTIRKYFELSPWVNRTRCGLSITTVSKSLYQFLGKYFGTGATNKKIPTFIIQSKNDIVKAFLSGYFDGDGYKYKNYDAVITVSRNIAYYVIVLFAKLGLKANLATRQGSSIIQGRNVNARIQYIVMVHNKHRTKFYRKNLHVFGKNHLYVPIEYVEKVKLGSVPVYNIQTEDETYCVPFVVHNCGQLNTALLHCGGDLVVRIDDCSEFDADFLQKFVQGYQNGYFPLAMHTRYRNGSQAYYNESYRQEGYDFAREDPDRKKILSQVYNEGNPVRDTRWSIVEKHGGRMTAPREWYYGYSSSSLEALLKINGYNELMDCDRSQEDQECGLRLWMAGYKDMFLLDTSHWVIEHEHEPIPERIISRNVNNCKCNYAIFLLNQMKNRWRANSELLTEDDLKFIIEETLKPPCSPRKGMYEDDCQGELFKLWTNHQPIFDLREERLNI